ncbi:MAG: Uncharacterized protein G01um101433_121 [Parcubacteria group bacterium Gr01-1014_33]|nr:MAG: Uncharacterized protein G01um101433_121 [Parcubacteria group bacterium Gr01-1014_33]
MFKFIIGWIVVFVIRFLPFRPPNVEPVLGTLMPFSKKYGAAGGFVFGFLSIALFDLASGMVGIWTLITGVSYGLLGVGAGFFFKNRDSSVFNYLKYAIVGTIAYDAATGLTIGPLFYGQPFMEAFYGQISFTLLHLLGNIVIAIGISPLIYRWVVLNKKLETADVFRKIRAVRAPSQ